jgi:O-antigen/teichoic acid export membrane protein
MPEEPELHPAQPVTQEEAQENHATTVRDSLSSNVAATTAARIGYLLTRFFIPPFVLAHVTLEAYGLWSAAFIVVSYIGISTMGLSAVYVKYVAEFASRREYRRANELLSTGLCFSIPGCLAVFGLLYWLWPQVVNWLHVAPNLRGDAREVVLLVAAIFLASISLSAFHDALVGVQRSALVQVIWVISYIIETGLIFWLVSAGRGIRGLAEAFVIRTIIEIVLSLIFCIRTLKWLRISPTLCTRESLRILLTFGSVVQIQSLLAVTLNSIERVLAAPLVGLQATGLLEISEKLPNMAASLPLGFASSFIPAASYLHGGLSGTPEQKESIRKLYLKGARYMNIATAFICGFLALLPAPLLESWVGKHYEGAAYLMVIFSIASQVNLMTGPGTSILKGIGRPKEEFYYCIPNVIVLLLAVPLSYLILGQWTTLGIGTAVAASTVIAAAYFVAHANRVLEVSAGTYFKSVLIPGIIPYAVAALFTWPAYYMTSHFNRWVSAGLVAGLGVIYSILLLVVIARLVLEDGERWWFQAIIQNKLGRFFPSKSVQAPVESGG